MNKNLKNEDLYKKLAGGKPLFESDDASNNNKMDGFEKAIAQTDNFIVPENKSKDEIWNDLKSKIDNNQKSQLFSFRKKQTVKLYFSIAASLILIVATAVYLLFYSTVNYYAAHAKQLAIVLPDNSEVELNAGSAISHKRFLWETNREVYLKGEAFFRVEKGSRFTVQTPNGSVAVLGTQFNVFARDEGFEVSCFEGKVEVISSLSKAIRVLEKGQKTFISKDNKLVSPINFNHEKGTGWRKGTLYFDKKPLNLVFKEIERQFNITIDYKGDKQRLYTGQFDIKNLDVALQIVCLPMQLNYTIENEIVYIYQ